MLSSNREDELLTKLKSCIGSLKNESSIPFQDFTSKQSYNSIKQNYRCSAITTPKAPSMTSNIGKGSSYLQQNYVERQPLGTANHLAPATVNSYIPPSTLKYQSQTNYQQDFPSKPVRFQPQPRPKTRADDIRSFETTPRKFQYTFEAKKTERQQIKPAEVTLGLEQPSRSRQDIRGQIARRYSLMQNDRAQKYSEPQQSYKYNHCQTAPITPAKMQAPSRNYQRQVEERKELLELQRRERTPQLSKQYVGSVRKEQHTSRDAGKIKAAEPILSARKPDRPLMLAQTLQRAYQQENLNGNECSALSKLRKISELNEKINDRIRNIINVFEDHKK